MGNPKQPTERGRILLERLEEQSLSIAEVERRTPLTKNTITNAIYGPREPQRKTIELLAEVLQLPVETLTRFPMDREPIPEAPVEPPADELSFGRSLLQRNNPQLWVCVLGIACTGYFLARGLQDGTLPWAVHGAQFGVIFLLLTMLPRYWLAPELDQSASHRLKVAAKAAQDFRRYWGAVWVCWLFLYFTLTMTTAWGFFPDHLPLPVGWARWAFVLLNFLQNSATVLLFLCYEVVARPTIEDDLSRKQVLPTEAWFAVVAVAVLTEAVVVGRGLPWELQQWFGWLSGFGQGTALALLVGRLDSKYVNPSAITIGLFYLYAVIQGAWPVFRNHYELMLILTFVALVLKCLLFLFLSWMFESNLILFYLARMRTLDLDVRSDRSDFLTSLRKGDVEQL
jgi:transcriptional regulator with XRE-family HTH domain